VGRLLLFLELKGSVDARPYRGESFLGVGGIGAKEKRLFNTNFKERLWTKNYIDTGHQKPKGVCGCGLEGLLLGRQSQERKTKGVEA